MPMIDVYAPAGTFGETHELARDLARAVMRWEGVSDIPLFADNTAAFIHHLPPEAMSDAAGAGDHVRVQVLTPAGVLDRDKQLGVVRELTEIVVAAAGDPALTDRTWVLITESPDGGWGIAGHANTQADIAGSARAALTGRSPPVGARRSRTGPHDDYVSAYDLGHFAWEQASDEYGRLIVDRVTGGFRRVGGAMTA